MTAGFPPLPSRSTRAEPACQEDRAVKRAANPRLRRQASCSGAIALAIERYHSGFECQGRRTCQNVLKTRMLVNP